MEQTIRDRLLLFLKHLGIGRTKFESNCGLSRGHVSLVKTSMNTDVLNRIKNVYPELNLNWLVTGEGEMLLQYDSNDINLINELHKRGEEIVFLRSIIKQLTK